MSALSAFDPPARTSRRRADAGLLVIDRRTGAWACDTLPRLAERLRPGDVLVVNDAATLPASIAFALAGAAGPEPIEARLLRCLDPSYRDLRRWQVVLFGAGDWRMPTETRPAPPMLRVGDLLRTSGLTAVVERIAASPASPAALSPPSGSTRLVDLRLLVSRQDAWAALYGAGRPVQYAYHEKALALWDQQTPFAAAPVALEPPSASLHWSWAQVFRLQDAGVEILPLTHATGLSSTGDPVIDAQLPVPEPYAIPTATAGAVDRAVREGRRVIAVGTGVTRALESAYDPESRTLRQGPGVTALKLGEAGQGQPMQLLSGLLTGLHTLDSSHLQLVGALVGRSQVLAAYAGARAARFLWHEYGDLCLIV